MFTKTLSKPARKRSAQVSQCPFQAVEKIRTGSAQEVRFQAGDVYEGFQAGEKMGLNFLMPFHASEKVRVASGRKVKSQAGEKFI
ncbi:hypothetical protein CHS0354_026656 [Potamilus streckersoni]|uniref:Uncharacterized protein n=1 Tax=Potamilus streckersoni TaxID=2493646 RepID=A0AAE0S8W4_9BIVA|nr:hypothetical protein CHS0354_026656 [Potamilus streckersoni]